MRYLILLAAALALATVSRAQTEGQTADLGPHPTRIWSDSGYFDMNNHLAVYTGNVHVDDPQLKMTCDKMTAKTPETGGRVDDVVAEGHVVLDMVDQRGQTNHATGDKLVYSYKVVNWVTNDTAVLTGNPRVTSKQGTMTGTKVTFDRVSGLVKFDNWETVLPATTNKPAATNQSVFAPTNAPPAISTNAPAITNVIPITNVPTTTNAPPVTTVPTMTNAPPVTTVPAMTNPPPVTTVPAMTNPPVIWHRHG